MGTTRKTKGNEILIPRGGEILPKNKRGRNISGGLRFPDVNTGHDSGSLLTPIYSRFNWPICYQSQSGRAVRRIDGADIMAD
jgi:apolipoprotein N-acyltransferase